MSSSFKVIIVGGGLSGALLANGLLNNHVEFLVYERDAANSNREGYQIRLGEGAQAGFDACLTPERAKEIENKLGRSVGASATAPSLYTTQFKELIDFSCVASYAKSAAINRVVLRKTLLQPIEKAGRIVYGKSFSSFEVLTINGIEKVKVNFSNGSSDMCDILVGSDGANSRINMQLGLRNIKRIETHWSFVSKGKLPYERMMSLPPKLRRGPIITSAKHCTMFYALYLPENFSETNVADDAPKIRYDEDAASFYWGFNIPVKDLPYTDAAEIKDRHQVVLNYAKDYAPELQNMLRSGKDDPTTSEITVLKFHASSQPAADWRKRLQSSGDPLLGNSRVWLIGDAIHAMQPNRGQGGNNALQDCADMLPQLLRLDLASKSPQGCTSVQVTEACDAYERIMIPRAFQWVKKSGGTSIPNLDFDGWLGKTIQLVGLIVVPLTRLYNWLLPN